MDTELFHFEARAMHLRSCLHVAVASSTDFLSFFLSIAAARKYFEEKARLNFDPVTGERLNRSASRESTPSSSPALASSVESIEAPAFEPLPGAVHNAARGAKASE